MENRSRTCDKNIFEDDSDYKYSESSGSSDSGSGDEGSVDVKSMKRPNRLPTRRPNPNVDNRNALMARENRRKKKEYVEMLENDINEQRKINKNLQKIMKKQKTIIHKLKNEKNYFKGILSNKTQILSLINIIKAVTIKNIDLNSISTNEFDSSYSSSPRSSPPQVDTLLSNTFGITSDIDYSLPPLCDTHNNWNDLLSDTNTNFNFLDSIDTCINEGSNRANSTISDEHSYFSTVSKEQFGNDGEDESGICLHISGGKLSLEFCAKCHENSKKPVIEEI